MPEPTATNPTIEKIKLLTSLVSLLYPLAGVAIGEVVTLIGTLPGMQPETAEQLNQHIKDAQNSIKTF